jgi:hypothetical protein
MHETYIINLLFLALPRQGGANTHTDSNSERDTNWDIMEDNSERCADVVANFECLLFVWLIILYMYFEY